MNAEFLRSTIHFIHPVKGRISVDGLEAGGLGIVRFSQPDYSGFENDKAKLSRKRAEAKTSDELNSIPERPDLREIEGFLILHLPTGRSILPPQWCFENLSDAKACTAELLTKTDWTAPFRLLNLLGGVVAKSAQKHRCYTGQYHYMRQLFGRLDHVAIDAHIANLRTQKSSVKHDRLMAMREEPEQAK